MKKNGEKTISTISDLAREMRAGFENVETRAARRQGEVLAAIAKMHGLDERMSKLEREVAVLRRKRG